jgi:hypothetical protein
VLTLCVTALLARGPAGAWASVVCWEGCVKPLTVSHGCSNINPWASPVIDYLAAGRTATVTGVDPSGWAGALRASLRGRAARWWMRPSQAALFFSSKGPNINV